MVYLNKMKSNLYPTKELLLFLVITLAMGGCIRKGTHSALKNENSSAAPSLYQYILQNNPFNHRVIFIEDQNYFSDAAYIVYQDQQQAYALATHQNLDCIPKSEADPLPIEPTGLFMECEPTPLPTGLLVATLPKLYEDVREFLPREQVRVIARGQVNPIGSPFSMSSSTYYSLIHIKKKLTKLSVKLLQENYSPYNKHLHETGGIFTLKGNFQAYEEVIENSRLIMIPVYSLDGLGLSIPYLHTFSIFEQWNQLAPYLPTLNKIISFQRGLLNDPNLDLNTLLTINQQAFLTEQELENSYNEWEEDAKLVKEKNSKRVTPKDEYIIPKRAPSSGCTISVFAEPNELTGNKTKQLKGRTK